MIYGGLIESYDDEKVIAIFKKKLTEENYKKFQSYCIDDDGNISDRYEAMGFFEDIKPTGFSVHYNRYDEDNVYIGIDPSNQKDDQTHGDWKKEIKESLIDVFGENVEIGWYEDCSYDG